MTNQSTALEDALRDNDPDSPNPYVVKRNLNKHNLQIAHGINRVLRPVNL